MNHMIWNDTELKQRIDDDGNRIIEVYEGDWNEMQHEINGRKGKPTLPVQQYNEMVCELTMNITQAVMEL